MDVMRSNAANALEQSKEGVAGNSTSVGRTLGAEMVRAGIVPDAVPLEEEEEEEDEAIVDEIINQESDDDEYIQTVITKTRKRVRFLHFLSEYMLIIIECRNLMVACQFQH